MSEKTLVVQHNAIIEARYKLTLEEQRVLKTLISQIQQNDEDFKGYEIRVLDLARLIGIPEEYYYTRIKLLITKLRRSSLWFKNENGDDVETGWLSSATYRKGQGIVELRFDPVLKPYLLQLKSFFTSYELGNILRLRSIYSVRIYELLKQYEKIGKREFSLDELKRILQIENEYKQYRDLKKSVISPAIIEICEKTDISFSIEEKKRGRKVIGFVFYISSKKHLLLEPSIEIDVLKETPTQSQQPQELPKPPQNEQPDQKRKQIETLLNMGVASFAIEELLAGFDADKINQGIAYTLEKKKDGTVKDTAGFVIMAIKRGFVDAHAQEKAREAEALRVRQEKERVQENLKRQWQAVKKQYDEWKTQAVKDALHTMTGEQLDGYKKQFIESPLYEALYVMLSKDEEVKKRYFLLHIREHLGLDTFEMWAVKNGVDVSVFPDEIRNAP